MKHLVKSQSGIGFSRVVGKSTSFSREVRLLMKLRLTVGAALTVAVLCGTAIAGDLKSGPQVGDQVGVPFHCLQVSNADNPSWNGQKQCLV